MILLCIGDCYTCFPPASCISCELFNFVGQRHWMLFISFLYLLLTSQDLACHRLFAWLLQTISSHLDVSQHMQEYTSTPDLSFFFKCIGRSETSVDEDSKIKHSSQQDQRAKVKGSAVWEERVSDVLPDNRASVTMMEMGV